MAAQLPANQWYDLVLRRLDDPAQREELVRQCTFCHQQGNWATRRVRDPEEWRKVLHLMGRMGGMVSADLREKLPALFNEAYAPETAVAALTARMGSPDFAPPPPPEVRRTVIEEWDLGGRASMQHDLTVHPDGRIYSVDMSQDQLYRLDPATGARAAWPIPRGDLPLGGVFADERTARQPELERPRRPALAPGRARRIDLDHARARQSARALRSRDRVVHHRRRSRAATTRTRCASIRAGGSGTRSRARTTWACGILRRARGRELRLPSRTLGQAVAMRVMPLALWVGRHFDLRGAAADGDGFTAPIPYGIDVAPDGSVWFSQLNDHRIGRVDPDDFRVEMFDTPFAGPRRLRFDAHGNLWIPGFSSSVVARFDPATREFREFALPTLPRGSETPYALNVHRPTGQVWICGTESDSLIRFDPRRGALHGVSAADAGHLHARDRLRLRGPRLDLELEFAGLADRGRDAAARAARSARRDARGDRARGFPGAGAFALERTYRLAQAPGSPKAMLFLLFVAGAHVEPSVHQELHSRVKARVSRD